MLKGIARGLRRSKNASLDHGKDDTPDIDGWVEILAVGVLITLRAGLASGADVEERFQLGYASAKMTWRSQRRRDRFRVKLTEAAGL